ncbi:uncharacterized protein [Rutidosis leptorrhynchoides]|uniref:uncharacterized protein n=1 Tax=Rutidosis leptorrhynchoides TaxID=125765 RepID=UPI003A9A21FF
MQILSLNVRGFAVKGKFGWVCNIYIKERPSIAVFQETKCGSVNDNWVRALWGESNFGYVQKEVVGKSGGLLLIWDSNVFDVIESWGCEFFLAIRGIWSRSGIESIIVNIYVPHNDREKIEMWDLLDKLINSIDSSWLLVGDFNEVRAPTDRQNSQFHQYRADRFNEFINRNRLIEIGISERKFTRISDDGLKFSKLDRFLVSDNFHSLWDDLSVIALDRHLSDHCPLMLRDKVVDYGPKPFKVFEEWFNCVEVDNIISVTWKKPVHGLRKDCIFRDRLKNVKSALREWSKSNFGGLDKEINELKKEAMDWEIKAEARSLGDSDRKIWLDCRRRWIDKERVKSNMLKQKARIKWILEGDENSKFFHASIRRRYNKCNIRGLNINGVWVEDPILVKNAVFEYY